jgi:hypothetical protein
LELFPTPVPEKATTRTTVKVKDLPEIEMPRTAIWITSYLKLALYLI